MAYSFFHRSDENKITFPCTNCLLAPLYKKSENLKNICNHGNMPEIYKSPPRNFFHLGVNLVWTQASLAPSVCWALGSSSPPGAHMWFTLFNDEIGQVLGVVYQHSNMSHPCLPSGDRWHDFIGWFSQNSHNRNYSTSKKSSMAIFVILAVFTLPIVPSLLHQSIVFSLLIWQNLPHHIAST